MVTQPGGDDAHPTRPAACLPVCLAVLATIPGIAVALLANTHLASPIAAGRGGSVAAQKAIEEPEALENQDSPCCGGQKPPTLSMSLGDVVTASINCEGIGIEVGTEGWIGAFASADFGFDGRVTVFAGPRAELGIEGVAKVGMKDGLYLTVDRNGIQDVGARVVFESSMELAGVTASRGIDSMDFSFVPST